jgi:starch synthase (maltosyl-transferring)
MLNLHHRVIIDKVEPQIDGGRFPVRRAVGETVRVAADIIADSHDVLAADLFYRRIGEPSWSARPMRLMVNDIWTAEFTINGMTAYEYTLEAWVDHFRTLRNKLDKKHADGQDVQVDLLDLARLVEAAALRADNPGPVSAPAADAPPADAGQDAAYLLEKYGFLKSDRHPVINRVSLALSPELARAMDRLADRSHRTRYGKILRVAVERPRARFGAWYEMFPRSCAPEAGRHGTFKDCVQRLSYIEQMGFDVLYLPPIHPIGTTHRKGPNNEPVSGPDDPGSPWAIGSADGGHRSVHPQLGSLEDFHDLMEQARARRIEIAMDLAFQCSPDHPYVREHPEWFRWRADNTVQYAENPPKKYQDIFPFDFENAHVEQLAQELLGVVRFWIDQGVRIFRVDNPHTKPLLFWQWLIAEIKKDHPETIFLAEAFTRPKTMYRLAKGGFTQSYTYFTWRNLKWEIEQYFEELIQTDVGEFFWPNLWPNTPDILPEYLQMGGRPAFVIRLVLAATLAANYGIYGPAFELCVNQARESFSEEYLDSEKYQIHWWQLNQEHSLKSMIARVNRIRRENPALQQDRTLAFHPVDNEQIICYSKHTEDLSNIILVVVNLDPHHTHATWLNLPLERLSLDPAQPFQMQDLLSGARYLWHAGSNYLELNPNVVPAHIFRIRRRVRSERDFDYFM